MISELHPWYGPCDGFADGECAECLAEEMKTKRICIGGGSAYYHLKNFVEVERIIKEFVCHNCGATWQTGQRCTG